jgi:hypothetical protein
MAAPTLQWGQLCGLQWVRTLREGACPLYWDGRRWNPLADERWLMTDAEAEALRARLEPAAASSSVRPVADPYADDNAMDEARLEERWNGEQVDGPRAPLGRADVAAILGRPYRKAGR